MPLKQVGPQRVEHTDGWSVAFRDRTHLQYEQDGRIAAVEIDDGFPENRVYVRSLEWLPPGSEAVPTVEERAVIWPRFVEGMSALGITPELFDG